MGALCGVYLWMFDATFSAAFQSDKIYSGHRGSQDLIVVFLAFQVWDLFTAIVVPDLRSLVMLAHHGTSLLLALCALMYGPPDGGFVMLYGAFFFGVAEAYSLPLIAMDVFKKNPELIKLSVSLLLPPSSLCAVCTGPMYRSTSGAP